VSEERRMHAVLETDLVHLVSEGEIWCVGRDALEVLPAGKS
jgi:hypothetical protein